MVSTHFHEIFDAPMLRTRDDASVELLSRHLLRPSFLRKMSYLSDPAISHAGHRKVWGQRASPHYGWLVLEIEFED